MVGVDPAAEVRAAGPHALERLPLPPRRPLLMGVLNATPDSFWAPSRAADPARAAEAAAAMWRSGADIIDIGAVSSRPGAPSVSVHEEWRRLAPVLAAVRGAVGCPVSVDTARGAVARAALAAGADLLNDISGLADADLVSAARDAGAPVVVMARRRLPPGADAVRCVRAEWQQALGRARAAGLPAWQLVLDPGFGFGKTRHQNLDLVRALPRLRAWFGLPLCLGPSRKASAASSRAGRPAARLPGTAAVVALAAAYGVDLLRVHDVAEMAEVAAVARAVGPPSAAAAAEGEPADSAGAAGLGRVTIRGLRLEACHGVLAEEAHRPQPFVVDVEMDLDLHRAAASDDLDATVDYARVAELVAQVVTGPRHRLIETLAGEIARAVVERFPAVRRGAVEVHKPRAPVGLPFEDVSVRFPFSRPGAPPSP